MSLELRGLKKHYEQRHLFGPKSLVRALDGVSFKLDSGRTLAIVGESGCGKSTLAKVLIQLEAATEGEILLDGKSAFTLPRAEVIRTIQMIFQDPYSSINPRKKAWQIISEPLQINQKLSKAECRDQAISLMSKVGLRPELANRYPHMFSGGQRQRIGIARALVLRPKIMVCDEPVSALDVSIQAQVINLLVALQDEFKLSYVFISHDLAVVRHLADDVLVMYLGKVVEYGPRQLIFNQPLHPYTRALLASSPHLGAIMPSQDRVELRGELPSPLNPPTGCSLHKRCPFATPRCSAEVPELKSIQGRQVACHFA